MCDAQSSSELFCIAETRRQHGLGGGWWLARGHWGGALEKKKGRAGMAVQPKSREETPKVGTPWWAGPGHGAALDMGVFVLRCNLAPGLPYHLREECGRLATWDLPNGNA
jgi:hypothetical protein